MAVYDALAAEYEHGMARVTGLHAADVAGALMIKPGARVLDLAAGTGAITEALADRAGVDGIVVATDIAAGMLSFARRRFAAAQNVRFVLGAGESLPFTDASFDAVACAFGIQHMTDADLALRSLRRVLRPGGRCAIAIWDAVGRDIKTPINEAFAALTAAPLSPAQDRWATPGTLARRMELAGFAQVDVRSSTARLSVDSLDEWWNAVTSGRLGDRLRAAGPKQTRRIRESAERRAASFATRTIDGWHVPSAALIAAGVTA